MNNRHLLVFCLLDIPPAIAFSHSSMTPKAHWMNVARRDGRFHLQTPLHRRRGGRRHGGVTGWMGRAGGWFTAVGAETNKTRKTWVAC